MYTGLPGASKKEDMPWTSERSYLFTVTIIMIAGFSFFFGHEAAMMDREKEIYRTRTIANQKIHDCQRVITRGTYGNCNKMIRGN